MYAKSFSECECYVQEWCFRRNTGRVNEEYVLREYNQLCLVYPNNLYVASAFATFLQDIMCREREAAEHARSYRILRSGGRIRLDRRYYCATNHIGTLPNNEGHVAMNAGGVAERPRNNKSRQWPIAGMIGTIEDGVVSEELSQHRYIEPMVDAVRMPAMRYGSFVIVVSLCTLLPAISAGLLVMHQQVFARDTGVTQVGEAVSRLEVAITQIPLIVLHFALCSSDESPSMHDRGLGCGLAGTEALGSDREIIQGLIHDVETSLEAVMSSFHILAPIASFKPPLEILLMSRVSLDYYMDSASSVRAKLSLQQIVTYLTSIAVRILGLSRDELMKGSDFCNLTRNFWLLVLLPFRRRSSWRSNGTK